MTKTVSYVYAEELSVGSHNTGEVKYKIADQAQKASKKIPL